MNIYEKLSAIQAELKAPKNQYNSYGGFNYRSCEDILENVKPICAKHRTVLILTDELLNIGERYYVKAVAKLVDLDAELNSGFCYVAVAAYAREEETKKGMDGSQVTGASSSYARKYALNGLFNIDDQKDSDYTNGLQNAPQTQKAPAPKTTPPERKPSPTITPDGDSQPVCKDCGAPIDVTVHDYSVRNYGAPYCRKCQKNHANK